MEITYLHGLNSSPHGTKATFFKKKAADHGLSFRAPDMGRDFTEHSFKQKIEIASEEIYRDTVLIGSSLGGYIASIIAAHNSVSAIVLIAPAYDYFARHELSEGTYYVPTVTCPTLAFIGDQDNMVSVEVVQRCTKGSVIVIPGGDHRLHEHMDYIWEKTLSFLLASSC